MHPPTPDLGLIKSVLIAAMLPVFKDRILQLFSFICMQVLNKCLLDE